IGVGERCGPYVKGRQAANYTQLHGAACNPARTRAARSERARRREKRRAAAQRSTAVHAVSRLRWMREHASAGRGGRCRRVRLRRSGKLEQRPADEQRVILPEHGTLGMSFGAADYAHDIRLACHGLDKGDNDFIVGLVGKDLYPLSAIVQAMRKTQQTALYLERLGPFLAGRAIWQS